MTNTTAVTNSSVWLWPFEAKLCDSNPPEERSYLPLFEFVISLILLVCVALPGLVGNFISIFILSRPQMRTSLNVILIGLASFDSILLVTSILLFVLPSLHMYVGEFYFRYVHPVITPYTFLLGMTAQTSSVYLTLAVTVERYVAVCHPLKARSWCTCRRGRVAVLVIGFVSFVYNLPRFFEVGHCLQWDAGSNETLLMLTPSPLRNNKTYVTWYIVTMYFVVMNFVPFTLLAILNATIYREVRKANQERSLLTNSQKREIGLATMLLCVVVVFFIFNILAMVVNIFEVANILVDEMTRVSNLLVSVNSSVNFIIYCIFGDKFKRLFLRYFCLAGYRRPASGRTSPIDLHLDNSFVSTNCGTNAGQTSQLDSSSVFHSARSNSLHSGRTLPLSRPILRTYHQRPMSNGQRQAKNSSLNGCHRHRSKNSQPLVTEQQPADFSSTPDAGQRHLAASFCSHDALLRPFCPDRHCRCRLSS